MLHKNACHYYYFYTPGSKNPGGLKLSQTLKTTGMTSGPICRLYWHYYYYYY